MRSLYMLAALAALSTVVSAQSLTTTFANNNGGSPGGAVYFDATSFTGINVNSLDLNSNAGAGTLDVYVVPGGTYVGNEANPVFWGTPVLTGEAFTGLGAGLPSNVALSAPIALPPGNYAVALVNSLGHLYTNGNGTNQQFANADLQLDLGSASNVPFSGTPFSPRVWNGTVNYTPLGGGTFATATAAGSGCGGAPQGDGTFYELFDGTTSTFDLSNTAFTMNWLGNGYGVAPGASAIVPPTGAGPLSLGDDQTLPVSLGFSIPTPAGDIDTIYVCSNGFIAFQSTTAAPFSESIAGLLTSPMILCPLWDDLNPTVGGTVDAEVDGSGVFHVTFTGISEFGATNSNDFQVSFAPGGNIEVKYGSVAALDALVGFSTGTNATDPGGIDISTALPITVTTGYAQADLGLSVVDRPIIGTSPNTSVDNIRGTAFAGAMNYGTAFPTPIDLTVIGAPGCLAYTNPLFNQPILVAAGSVLVGVPIANDPALVGISLDQQAVVADPSYPNAIGVATTGTVTWNIGDL